MTRLADEKNAYAIMRLASVELHLSSFKTHLAAVSMGGRSKVNAAAAVWFRKRAAHVRGTRDYDQIRLGFIPVRKPW
jgi:hypothetical protein